MDRTRRRFDTAERQTRRRQDEVAERRQGGRGGRASGGSGGRGRGGRGGRGQSSPPRRTVTGYQMRRVGREVNESRRAGRGRGRGGQSGSGQRQIGRGRGAREESRSSTFATFGRRRQTVRESQVADREITRRTRGGRGGRGGRAGGRGNTGGDRRRIGRGRGQQQAAPSGRFRAGLKPLDNRRGGRGGRGGAQGRGGRGPSLVDRDALDKQLDSYRK